MGKDVIEISTEVFLLLQERGPQYVSWSEKKPGPTQRILVSHEVYTELVDRAISERKTFDRLLLDALKRNSRPAVLPPVGTSN